MEERVRASLSATRLIRIVQLGCPQLDAKRFYAGLPGFNFLCGTAETSRIIVAVFLYGWLGYAAQAWPTNVNHNHLKSVAPRDNPVAGRYLARLREMEGGRPVLAHQHCR
jgi:hypothetical protein